MAKPALPDTARAVLNAACEHPERFAQLPAQRAVILSLLKAGQLEEVEAAGGQSAQQVTDAGILAIGTV